MSDRDRECPICVLLKQPPERLEGVALTAFALGMVCHASSEMHGPLVCVRHGNGAKAAMHAIGERMTADDGDDEGPPPLPPTKH